ncbi:MAG: leader peptide processing enzyme [Spirochaetales bacterium]|nr:leader peptide processing enzyme [Spirochaetales bacterium]
MNKKLNTALFIVGASILNVILMIIFITIGLIILSKIVPENISPTFASVLFILIFLLSIAGSFFVYHKSIRILSGKINMDKYFHPIFSSRKK